MKRKCLRYTKNFYILVFHYTGEYFNLKNNLFHIAPGSLTMMLRWYFFSLPSHSSAPWVNLRRSNHREYTDKPMLEFCWPLGVNARVSGTIARNARGDLVTQRSVSNGATATTNCNSNETAILYVHTNPNVTVETPREVALRDDK